jgi:DNA helicase-2/ATP-dependent DNA helicase PcrA
MAEITGDDLWKKEVWLDEEGAALVLEHRMAAARLGFLEMWDSLRDLKEFDSVKDHTSPEINWFANFVMPLIQTENPFEMANITKKNNKDLFKKADKEILGKIKSNVDKIKKAYADNLDITFGEMVEIVREGGVFELPRKYNEESERFAQFLSTKYSQIVPYSKYVNETSGFRTHQGVKGLEFSRVMAIIDDNEAGGNWFSYEKLFGIKNKTETDLRNEREGKETSIDRTRRLFYVICTRAKESLAIVLYADTAKQNIPKDWFTEDEVIVLR